MNHHSLYQESLCVFLLYCLFSQFPLNPRSWVSALRELRSEEQVRWQPGRGKPALKGDNALPGVPLLPTDHD